MYCCRRTLILPRFHRIASRFSLARPHRCSLRSSIKASVLPLKDVRNLNALSIFFSSSLLQNTLVTPSVHDYLLLFNHKLEFDAQRLLETEVFRLVSKSKNYSNVFDNPDNLFRFREDENQGSVCRLEFCLRLPLVHRTIKPHKAVSINLQSRFSTRFFSEFKVQ